MAPLDPGAENLPPRYLGHSCRGLASKLVSLKPQKGEFETTAAYNERIESLKNTPLAGSTSFGDVVGFVQGADVYSGIDQSYDADRGVLKVSDNWGVSTQMVKSQLVTSVRLDQKIKHTRTYTASNAYGKKVTVDSTTWDTCGVAFSNLTYYSSLSSGFKRLEESIEMPPDEARSAKGNIALVFVGKLSEPFWSEFHDYSKPTIENPTEMAWTGDSVVMELIQVWIFNRQTGKIYKKITI
jgi:hypothetical protein